MNRNYLKFVLPLLMMTAQLLSDEGGETLDAPTIDAVVVPVEAVETAAAPLLREYDHRINFNWCRLGYERIQPEAMYVGIEGWSLPLWKSDSFAKRAIAEAEARVGYNFFFNARDHFTPVLGLGYFKDFNGHAKQGVAYVTTGFLYNHEFNQLFGLGLNVKGLVGRTVEKEQHSWGNPIWGYDVSALVTFRFSRERHWDFRLEPFYLQMAGQDSEHAFWGFRSYFGYRF